MLPSQFLAGRKPPPGTLASPDVVDFYNTHIDRAFEGYSYKGTRITGDHSFFLNFTPIECAQLNSKRTPTGRFHVDYPEFSQSDDYVFKQIEEAQGGERKLIVMLFTHRGYGKTFIFVSIVLKHYLFVDFSHNLITASGDAHADKTFSKARLCLDEMVKPARHPALNLKRLQDSRDIIESGEIHYDDHGKHTSGRRSKIERMVYDREAGKTKGGRYDTQIMEECGDWSRPARLKDCIMASKGSWRVGNIDRCRVFMPGTGGTVYSHEAKEIFYNPAAFGIYQVKEHSDRSTAIFIPAYKKYGGTWELTGESNEKLAKTLLDAERIAAKADPVAYTKLIQEFPYTPDEMFSQSSGNLFNREKLARQLVDIIHKPAFQLVKRYHLHYLKVDGRITGVEAVEDPRGEVEMVELPQLSEDGKPVRGLYVAGLDSIDQGTQHSVEQTGSCFSLRVKKRQSTQSQTGNLYVCRYHARPRTVEEAYEIALKILLLYDCRVNLEYSKIAFIGFMRERKAYHRLLPRPSLQRAEMNANKFTHLIGTVMNQKTKQYGDILLQQYVEDFADQLYFKDDVEELLAYEPARQNEFDGIVSMKMCEIADEDLFDAGTIAAKQSPGMAMIGYYMDPHTGYMRYGALPKQQGPKDLMPTTEKQLRFYDPEADKNAYY